jgi:hypothetical protein
MPDRICSVVECDRAARALGMCSMHYDRSRSGRRDQRAMNMIWRYGLTLADYETLFIVQGGVCAICHQPPGAQRLSVDHDHACCPGYRSCGKCIRGLLCARCNSSLGWFENNVSTVSEYLHA